MTELTQPEALRCHASVASGQYAARCQRQARPGKLTCAQHDGQELELAARNVTTHRDYESTSDASLASAIRALGAALEAQGVSGAPEPSDAVVEVLVAWLESHGWRNDDPRASVDTIRRLLRDGTIATPESVSGPERVYQVRERYGRDVPGPWMQRDETAYRSCVSGGYEGRVLQVLGATPESVSGPEAAPQ